MEHQNILHFYKLLKTSNHIYMVYEYCPDGNLENYLKMQKNGILEENKAIEIIK